MSIEAWLTFGVVFTLLGLPIGPNAVTTVAAAVANGLPKGFLVPMGIAVASVIHALVAALGFGALLLASAELFTALKWLGAAYLLWLGIRLWWREPGGEAVNRPRSTSAGRLIARGCLVSLSNPKAVLTYMAVFPQFISLAEPVGPQLALLIPTATGIVVVIYSTWAALAFPLREWLRRPRRMRAFNRTAGTFYVFSAAGLALTEPR